MAITAKDVMALRQKTGLGMMECKEALTEVDGDVDKAVDLLRQRGLAKMDSRSERTSAEGRINAAVSDDGSKGAIVEINSETDFTASNDAFLAMADTVATEAIKGEPGEVVTNDAMKAAIDEVRLTTKENIQFARGAVLGGPGSTVGQYVHFTGKVGVLIELDGKADDALLKDLCMHISAVSPAPLGVTEDEVPAEVVEKEREIAKAQAIESGKPEQIAEKMVEGKIRKFYDETVLLRQPFIKDDKKQIKDLLPNGVTIKKFVRYQVGG
ncbi:translation elongation factor Ts [Phycisphaerales bacterium AB-hyl4]|uniref:Elongation factor Ts n=1 Tax=Natronomicrosphaera hydrolytica TaxID=3242702 RepID=A0ABV4TZK6_9BACT